MPELEVIQNHVKKSRDAFMLARCNQGEFSPRERRGKNKKDLSIGDRQDSGRAVSEAYNSNMPTDLAHFDDMSIRRVAASYAYHLDRLIGRSRSYNFCFAVAWAELCAIKARATGGNFVTMASGYTESMSMNKKMVKIYREEMEVR